MTDYGFIRAAAAVPVIKVADIQYNTGKICELIRKADNERCSLVAFPELSLTGFTCGDLFWHNSLLSGAEKAIKEITDFSRNYDTAIIVGTPVAYRNKLYNCAAVIRHGVLKGLVPKTCISSHGESGQSRWFSSGNDFSGTKAIGGTPEIEYAGMRCHISPDLLFSLGKTTIAIEIGEDMLNPVPRSSWHCLSGAEIIVNISAGNELVAKNDFRISQLLNQSAKTISGYVYSSPGYGESTQDTVFAGTAMICENGRTIARNELFSIQDSITIADIDTEKLSNLRLKSGNFDATAPDGTPFSSYQAIFCKESLGDAAVTDFMSKLWRKPEPLPFIPEGSPEEISIRLDEVLNIQVYGLMKRLSHINCKTAVIGISGGLDSTLALLVTTLAFDRLGWKRDRIVSVTMPGYGTTDRTYSNAMSLMNILGTTVREISIREACDRHFADIGHDKSIHDVTYENAQARERTQILMDIANQTGGIVIGTGDLSELALGWATYNGDQMSMYGVNAGVPKTLVKLLVARCAETMLDAKTILEDIIDTPISPELLPAAENGTIKQKTEDLVGPYELHDFFLYNFVRLGFSQEKIFFLASKAFDGKEGRPFYDNDTIRKWLDTFIRRFFNQQFKRSCMPDGPKIGTVSLSPRGDWNMPSDASSAIFRQ